MKNSTSFPPLYHYTSQVGLLGMHRFKKLWFTHINYLNDSEEFFYSLDKINEVIEEEYGKDILDDLLEVMPKRNRVYPMFIFSLSERRDSLSQWRGYCPNGGYSVSFKEDYLTALSEYIPNPENIEVSKNTSTLKKRRLVIKRCCYKKSEQRELIKDRIIGNLLEQYAQERRRGYLKKGILPYVLLDRIYQFAPLIKHPKFKDEREWRIVVKYFQFRVPDPSISSTHYIAEVDPEHYKFLQFREGKSGIVPFIEFKSAGIESNQNIFSEIVIGPNPHQEIAIQACKMLTYGDSINISSSEIPYRNW